LAGEFHVHTNASLLVVGVMSFQNLIRKSDQSMVYPYKNFNKVEHNYSTTTKEALVMVFTLHKFRYYLSCNKFVFYVDQMALVYMFNKLHVSGRVTKWLLLFLIYNFTIMYKHSRTHVVVDVLLRLLNTIEPTWMLNQTIDASLFYVKPNWLNYVKDFLNSW
jgi:hypothetical protein